MRHQPTGSRNSRRRQTANRAGWTESLEVRMLLAAPQNLALVQELPFEAKLQLSITDPVFPANAFVSFEDRFNGDVIHTTSAVFPVGAGARIANVSLPVSKLPGHHKLVVRVAENGNVGTPSSTINVDVSYRPLDVTIAGNNVSINWQAQPGASAYDIWINNETTNTAQFVRNQNLPTNTYSGNFTGGSFKVWVRAKLQSGAWSEWSLPSLFTMDGPIRMQSPVGTFKDGTGDETFVWSKYKDATGYQLWVTYTTTNTRVIYQDSLAAQTTSYSAPTDLPPGSYSSWVRPKFAGGTFGVWSQVLKSVITPREIKITGGITGPLGGTFNRTPTITWRAGEVPMVYDLTVRTNLGPPNLVYSRTGLTGTSHLLTTPLNTGSYIVAIVGRSTTGITTPTPLAEVNLVIGFPTAQNQAPTYAGNRTLNWVAVAGAMHFDLQVDSLGPSPAAQNSLFRNKMATGTSQVLPNSLPPGNYRAWIRSVRVEGGYTFFGTWTLSPLKFSITSLTQESEASDPLDLQLAVDDLSPELPGSSDLPEDDASLSVDATDEMGIADADSNDSHVVPPQTLSGKSFAVQQAIDLAGQSPIMIDDTILASL